MIKHSVIKGSILLGLSLLSHIIPFLIYAPLFFIYFLSSKSINLEKLVGVRVWDNKVKVSGTIKSVKFDNKINAKPDSMGFVNVGEVNKFSAVIQWHSGKTQVVTGPYLCGDEAIFFDK